MAAQERRIILKIYKPYQKDDSQFIIIIQSMSAIIDGQVFSHSPQQNQVGQHHQSIRLVQALSKKLSPDCSTNVLAHTSNKYQLFTRLHLMNKDYLLMIATQNGHQLVVTACEIHGGVFSRGSQLNEREVMKEVTSLQFHTSEQAVIYAREGRLVMVLKMALPFILPRNGNFIDIYNRIIHKNTHRLHNFLIKKDRTHQAQLSPHSEFYEQLCLTKLVHTDANFDYSEQRTQYKQGQAALKNQRNQLKMLVDNIIIENTLEKGVDCLYLFKQKEAGSAWAKSNLAYIADSLHRKYKNSLQVPSPPQRKIEDFVFNSVSIEVRDRMAKPIADGGSSLIFLAKGVLSFVSSLDHPADRHQERVEKLIAMKTLRPGLQGKVKDKLEHEKQIVARMHGGCCFFLPKYYGTDRGSELSTCLLMEYLNGEPLDIFLKARSATISMRTKLYLLLNMVLGIRFLISRQIVHLDLKPSNLIVCRQLIPKIIDFGEAYHRDLCPKQYSPAFTFPYVAPEVYMQYQYQHGRMQEAPYQFAYSEKQDVFAFGMIMHQMLLNSAIFRMDSVISRKAYLQREISSHIFLCSQRLPHFGDEFILSIMMYTMIRCWQMPPQRRPKFDWIGVLLKLLLNFFKNN